MGRFFQAVRVLRCALLIVVGTLVNSGAPARADNFQTLYNFTGGVDGSTPNGHLLNVAGTIYGTTQAGGAFGDGAIFAIGTDGSQFRSVYSFGALPGYQPISGLVAAGSKLYGTTYYDVPYDHGNGTVFSVNTDGSKFQNLHDFDYDETNSGAGSPDSLLAVVGSNLYGRTQLPYDMNREGAVYTLGLDGSSYQTLYKFSSGENAAADIAALGPTLFAAINDYTIVGSQMYGVIPVAFNTAGAIFSMNLDGSNEHILYSFTGDGPDGAAPLNGLTLVGNRLYGTSSFGGPVFEYGNIFSLNLDGSGFRIEHSFVDSDGARPMGGLTLIGDTLYGTTSAGGLDNAGTIFGVTVPASQVPEPATWLPAVVGLLVLVYTRRRTLRWSSPSSAARHAALFALIGMCMALSGPRLARAVTLQAGDIVAFDTGTNTLYEIDPTTGVRTILANSTVGTGVPLGNISGMAVDAAGDIFLASNADYSSNGDVLRVDPTTGNRTVFAPLQRLEATLAISNDGKLLAAESNTAALVGVNNLIAKIDPVSGATLSSVTVLRDSLPENIAQSPAGSYYIVNGISSGLIRNVDPSTGALTALRFPATWQASSLTFDQSGSVFFTDGFYAVHRLDLTTGTDTLISGPTGHYSTIGGGPLLDGGGNSDGPGINSIAFAPDGSLIVAGYNGGYNGSPSIFRIDPVTGDRTIVSQVYGGNAGGGSFYTAVVPSVPEPSTLALASLAFLAFAVRAVRRHSFLLCVPVLVGAFASHAIAAKLVVMATDTTSVPGAKVFTIGVEVTQADVSFAGSRFVSLIIDGITFEGGPNGPIQQRGASVNDIQTLQSAYIDEASLANGGPPTNAALGPQGFKALYQDSWWYAGGGNLIGVNDSAGNEGIITTNSAADGSGHYTVGPTANVGPGGYLFLYLQGDPASSSPPGSMTFSGVYGPLGPGPILSLTEPPLSNFFINGVLDVPLAQIVARGNIDIASPREVISLDDVGFNVLGGDTNVDPHAHLDYATNQIVLPEPATLSLGLLAVVGLSVVGRRRRESLVFAALSLICTLAFTLPAHAQINDLRTGQLLPGTAGITPGPGVDLSNWNSAGHSLQYANFSNGGACGLDLTGAVFDGSWLDNASFYKAIVPQISFVSSSLTSADFSFANATNANFTNANLTGAALDYATLTGANLTGATITGANFNNSSLTLTQLASTASYQNQNLSGINFSGMVFNGLSLAGQDLKGSVFEQAKLAGASLAGANVQNADFRRTDLTMSQLVSTSSYQNANLSGVNLTGINLAGLNLGGQNLSGASLGFANLSAANLAGANLTGASIAGTDLRNTNITAQQIYATYDYQTHSLYDTIFAGDNLTNWNLAGQTLDGVDFTGAIVAGLNLTNANLTNAHLDFLTMTGVNLIGANVRGVDFSNSSLTAQQLYSTATYQSSDLTGINFSNDDLTGWNFAGKTITNVNFTGATLAGVNFSGQYLPNASFSGVNLTGVNFQYAYLPGANFANATMTDGNLQNANLGNASLAHADLTNVNATLASLQGANLTGANLSQAILQGANLQGATLTGADLAQAQLGNVSFNGVSLAGVNLTNAAIRGANFNGASDFTKEQLYSTADYQNKNLSGTGFAGNSMNGWNFAGQNLTFTSFTNAALVNADLSHTSLGFASFNGANVTGADFTGATINTSIPYTTGLTKISGVIGFTSQQLYSTASYANHDLTFIDFSNSDLSGWSFAGQNLQHSQLSGASLAGANFNGANVAYVDFTNTDLTSSQLYATASYQQKNLTQIVLTNHDLSNWNLAGQNLMAANLQGANITGTNLQGAIINQVTFAGTALTSQQLYSTASYQSHDLTSVYLPGIDLSNWDFSNQKLAGASFANANLTGANFTNATVNADSPYPYFPSGTVFFGASGFTSNQLYSTASYQNHNLIGVNLQKIDLTGWNFSGQNLYSARLTGSALVGANFTDADLSDTAFPVNVAQTGAIFHNTIMPDHSVTGLALGPGEHFVAHQDNFSNAYFIVGVDVRQSMSLSAASQLTLVLHDSAPNAAMYIEAGDTVQLGGTLELTLSPAQFNALFVGESFQAFEWNGTLAPGQHFDQIISQPGYTWDTSQLYTTGYVTLTSVPEPSTWLLGALGMAVARAGANGRCASAKKQSRQPCG
jgi:uncharacterized protein YjbI with pentapeptide repeats